MRVNLVGEQAKDRIDMALCIARERYGSDLDDAVITLTINGETVKITGDSAVFFDGKIGQRGTETPVFSERPQYKGGFWFKHWCASRRK